MLFFPAGPIEIPVKVNSQGRYTINWTIGNKSGKRASSSPREKIRIVGINRGRPQGYTLMASVKNAFGETAQKGVMFKVVSNAYATTAHRTQAPARVNNNRTGNTAAGTTRTVGSIAITNTGRFVFHGGEGKLNIKTKVATESSSNIQAIKVTYRDLSTRKSGTLINRTYGNAVSRVNETQTITLNRDAIGECGHRAEARGVDWGVMGCSNLRLELKAKVNGRWQDVGKTTKFIVWQRRGNPRR